MRYIVKLNGDPKVTDVFVETWTTFPNENQTAWIGKGKHRHESYAGKEEYLHFHDSVYISPDLQVYPGCTRYMEVRFYFTTDTLNTYRDYIFELDTIKHESDGVLFMDWPEDSAKYEYHEHSYKLN